jgi:hypothetical protein
MVVMASNVHVPVTGCVCYVASLLVVKYSPSYLLHEIFYSVVVFLTLRTMVVGGICARMSVLREPCKPSVGKCCLKNFGCQYFSELGFFIFTFEWLIVYSSIPDATPT